MWPFRRSQTPPDVPDRHQVTLDLIEQVAVLRGQVGSLEIEWGNVKDILQKSYQRMEKANSRAERRLEDPEPTPEPTPEPQPADQFRGHSFIQKLEKMRA